MTRRLSGWARLWIVILVPAWMIATGIGIYAEHQRWEMACDWNGCPSYGPWMNYREGYSPIQAVSDENRFAEYQFTPEQIAAEQTRRSVRTNIHVERLTAAIVNPALAAIGAFILAMAAKGAAIWVWRGFRP